MHRQDIVEIILAVFVGALSENEAIGRPVNRATLPICLFTGSKQTYCYAWAFSDIGGRFIHEFSIPGSIVDILTVDGSEVEVEAKSIGGR